MKIKSFGVVFMLLISVMAFANEGLAQKPLEYKGIGIMKVQKGDLVKITPEKAYILNVPIFELTMSALEYVETNKSDSIITSLQNRIEKVQTDYSYQTLILNKSLAEHGKLLELSKSEIDNLSDIRDSQKEHIKVLEYQNREVKTALIKQRKKSRIRTATLIPVAAVAIWLGYEHYFSN